MNPTNTQAGQRILVIDDNRAIHEDFCKILGANQPGPEVLEEREAFLFGEPAPTFRRQVFQIDSAFPAYVRVALRQHQPRAPQGS